MLNKKAVAGDEAGAKQQLVGPEGSKIDLVVNRRGKEINMVGHGTDPLCCVGLAGFGGWGFRFRVPGLGRLMVGQTGRRCDSES
jgi:hypothetical protein